jgi:O-antigen/teichoic acid export membrane protein
VSTSLKRNILANFIGNGWTTVMSVVFIPLYIHFMGIEAYGLVGFFLVLQAAFSILDMGLSATLSREMARHSVQPERAQEMRDLARTLEVIYWAIAVIIGLGVITFASTIAHRWLNAGQLATGTIEQSIVLMGLALSLQWPFSLYSGGLMGLQRQVLLNGLNVIIATLRGGGAVLILWLISPTIQAFFSWQIFISALRAVLVALLFWRSLPTTGKTATFKINLFSTLWRFMTGMASISAITMLLGQVDKIILSKMVSLKMFGYYMLAAMGSSIVVFLVTPFFSAIYPRLTQLVALGNYDEIKELYHRSCQTVSVFILPTSLVVAFFSREILFIWTQNHITTDNTSLIFSILVIGGALSGLLYLPFVLQLAYGWTRLTFCINSISLVFLVPYIIIGTIKYGLTGAAIGWIVVYSGYILFAIPFMHRRLLPGEQWRWYVQDVGLPLLVALGITGVGRWLVHGQMSLSIVGLVLLSIYVTALAGTALAAPLVRSQIMGIAQRLRVTYGI